MKTEDPADELFRLKRLCAVAMNDGLARLTERMRAIMLGERLRHYLGLRLEGEEI